MNIWQNGTEQTIDHKNGSLVLSGNGNRLRILSSGIVLTINGNSNRVECARSRVQVTVNGNNNLILTQSSETRIGFNGNQNTLQTDPSSRTQILFSNGVNNAHRSQHQPHNPQPRQQPQSRQSSSRQQPRNRRGESSQPRMRAERNVPQQRPQYQQPQQHVRHHYNFNHGMLQQTENMINQIHRQMQDMMVGRPRRAYFFQHDPREDDFSSQQQENKGLSPEEVGLLPRSKHTGRDGKCTICLCEVTEGENQTFLACFHSFHWECIRDWMVKNSKCPMCQYDIKEYLQPQIV